MVIAKKEKLRWSRSDLTFNIDTSKGRCTGALKKVARFAR